MTNILVHTTEKYVKNLLAEQMNKNFLFHTQGYAMKSISKAKKILETTDVTNVEANTILIATWFMHSGFAVNYENHLNESLNLATNFLKNNRY